jgi:hypothetical protein
MIKQNRRLCAVHDLRGFGEIEQARKKLRLVTRRNDQICSYDTSIETRDAHTIGIPLRSPKRNLIANRTGRKRS